MLIQTTTSCYGHPYFVLTFWDLRVMYFNPLISRTRLTSMSWESCSQVSWPQNQYLLLGVGRVRSDLRSVHSNRTQKGAAVGCHWKMLWGQH